MDMQWHWDCFGQTLLVELGLERKAISNHVHMGVSGHFAEFIRRLGNLYSHSQQGFEGLNGTIKKFILRRTTRGGGRGSGSRLEGWINFQLRKICYMLGLDLDEIIRDVRRDREATHNAELAAGQPLTAGPGELSAMTAEEQAAAQEPLENFLEMCANALEEMDPPVGVAGGAFV